MSLQLYDSVKTFKYSIVVLVTVLKAFPEHQAADDIGHGVMNQCLGIKRLPYKRGWGKKCHSTNVSTTGSHVCALPVTMQLNSSLFPVTFLYIVSATIILVSESGEEKLPLYRNKTLRRTMLIQI